MRKQMNRIVNLALMILAVLSLMLLQVETFRCRVPDSFVWKAVALCVVTWAVTHCPKGTLAGLPLLAAGIFYIVRYRLLELKLSFEDLADRVTGVFLEQIHPGRTYPFAEPAPDHSLLFLILALLFALWLALALTSRGARLHLSLIGGLPFFAVCILLNEDPPVLPAVGMLLFWLLVAAGGSDYQESASGWSAVLGTLLPFLLLLFAVARYVNPEEYVFQKPDPDPMELLQKAEESIERLADGMFDLSGIAVPDSMAVPSPQQSGTSRTPLPQPQREERPESEKQPEPEDILWEDASGGMDFSDSLDESDLQRVFLRLRAPGSGMLYLRALSFGDYVGTGWRRAEDCPEGSSLTFTAASILAAGGEERTLQILPVVASHYAFQPYFSLTESASDSHVPYAGTEEYSVSYVRPAGVEFYYPGVQQEAAYRAFVRSVYTRLPESTLAALRALCEREGLSADSPDILTEVAAYVQSIGVYDLEQSSSRSGDLAVSFLTEDPHGVCIHFATAATALYRSLGIPARLTEGFLVEAESGRWVDVKGADAHAWVEVYQSGVGWVPVEVTGQSGLDASELLPEAVGLEDASGIPSPSPVPTEPDEAPADSSAGLEAEENALAPEPAENTPSGREEGMSDTESTEPPIPAPLPASPSPQLPVGVVQQPAGAERTPFWQTRLFYALCAAALFALLPLRRALLLSLRRRRLDRCESGHAVILLYRLAQRVSRYGRPVPPELLSLAEKAAFSQHSVSHEEAELCRTAYSQLVRTTRSELKWWKKLKFSLLDALG